MPLTIRIERRLEAGNKGRLTVELEGSLDTATAPDLEKKLTATLDEGVHHVVFELAKLSFISSAGLRVLSMTRKKVRERGGQVSVVNAQPQIQAVFEVIRALPGMMIFESVAELDEYLAARQRATLENTPPERPA